MLSHTTRRSAVACLLPLAAADGYAAMWLGYRQGWGWLNVVDSSALTAAHDAGVKHPGWVQFWDAVCTVFAPSTFRLLGVVAAAVALARRRLRAALFVLVSVELSELVTQLAKGLADRPRPATALVTAASSSFPSGHALAAMVGMAALLTLSLPALSHSARVAAVVVGALIVAAVGLGRIALNVHHPSDVLAGWALGYLYFLMCAWLFRPAAHTRRSGPEHGSLDLDGRFHRTTGPDR
jgi:undecaprenyl-diphosphatase